MLGIVLPASYVLLEALLEEVGGGNSYGVKRTKSVEGTDDEREFGIAMAHIRDDFDASIAQDTVFDWGFSRDSLDGGSRDEGGGGGDAAPGGKAGPDRTPSSRYDPKAMSRIVDITDLVDDSDDQEEDSDGGDFEDVGVPRAGAARPKGGVGKGKGKRPSRGWLCLALSAVAAVVASGGVAVGYLIVYPQDFGNALRPSRMGQGQRGARQQLMLETAESVAAACDVTGGGGDLGDCRELCKEKDCCFDQVDSCAETPGAECALYGACLALWEGTPYDAAEEEEG